MTGIRHRVSASLISDVTDGVMEQARAPPSIEDAVAKTLQNGKQGFVIAVLSERGSREAEMVVAVNGEMKQGLYHILRKLLSARQTKQAATGP